MKCIFFFFWLGGYYVTGTSKASLTSILIQILIIAGQTVQSRVLPDCSSWQDIHFLLFFRTLQESKLLITWMCLLLENKKQYQHCCGLSLQVEGSGNLCVPRNIVCRTKLVSSIGCVTRSLHCMSKTSSARLSGYFLESGTYMMW
jgi:hypothetical protein